MTFILHEFALCIRDGKEVFLLPKVGEPRRLPAREAQHAIAFLGLNDTPTPLRTVPNRIAELGKPLDDAPVKLSGNPLAALYLLGNEARSMTHREINSQLRINDSSCSSALSRLVHKELAINTKFNPAQNGLSTWEISSLGIDWLAAHMQDKSEALRLTS